MVILIRIALFWCYPTGSFRWNVFFKIFLTDPKNEKLLNIFSFLIFIYMTICEIRSTFRENIFGCQWQWFEFGRQKSTIISYIQLSIFLALYWRGCWHDVHEHLTYLFWYSQMFICDKHFADFKKKIHGFFHAKISILKKTFL